MAMKKVDTVINGMRTTIKVRDDAHTKKRTAANKAGTVGSTAPADVPVDVSKFHTGGGWYDLPNGERVRGEDNARAALAEE